jgi:riboflavin synthase
MFTGIVAAVGRITRVQSLGGSIEDGVRLAIDAGELGMDDVQLGDSIAIQGACMTVVAFDKQNFEVDVSRESLNRTVGLDCEGEVNLEKALRVGDRLGGHIVSGHVDGLGSVVKFETVGESHELVVRMPQELARYLAYKGSVTINGVSLTVNAVRDHASGCDVSMNLIPHTVEVTTLKHLRMGRKVNVEIDTVARYVDRMLEATSLKP